MQWIIDTHPHADHLTAADHLKDRTGAPTVTGARVVDVQALWAAIYGWADAPCDGSQWDRLLEDGERLGIGDLDGEVVSVPGHTMASIALRIGDAAFVNDTLFMPDSGTARADFPGGCARQLHASITRILALPDETRVFVGHDYGPGGRDVRWESTVAEQKATNTHFASRPTVERFVALRQARDATLPMPRLILHALQVNLAAGRLPAPDAHGRRFLRYPLNGLKQTPSGGGQRSG